MRILKLSRAVRICIILIAGMLGTAFNHGQGMHGLPAPRVTAEAWVNGGPVTVGGPREVPLILCFLQSGDAACGTALAALNHAAAAPEAAGIAIAGLTSDRDRDTVAAFILQHSIAWPVGIGSKTDLAYVVPRFPFFAVIDCQGIITWEGPDPAGAAAAAREAMPQVEVPSAAEIDAMVPESDEPDFAALAAEGERDFDVLVGDRERALAFMRTLREQVEPQLKNPEVVRAAVNLFGRFLLSAADDEVRTAAAQRLELFKMNREAFDRLAAAIQSLTGRSTDHEDLLKAVLRAVPHTAPFDPAAAGILALCLEPSFGSSTEIRRNVLINLRWIKTAETVDILIKTILKYSPDPEDPRDQRGGNDRKRAEWETIGAALYDSLESLTGVKQKGGAPAGAAAVYRNTWAASKWRKWLNDNRGDLMRTFRDEEQKRTNM